MPIPGTLVSATAISSVSPSEKKSWFASPDALAKGSTATVGRAAAACAAAEADGGQRISPIATARTKPCPRLNPAKRGAIAPCPHDPAQVIAS